MSAKPSVTVGGHEADHGSTGSYIAGFGLSLVLTIAAYLLVVKEVFSGWALVYSLAALAVAQLSVQLVFFLHLGRESKPRWNLQVLVFAAGVVVIVVFGSLWIMQNLQYNHSRHSPGDTDEFIIKDEGYEQ